MGRSVKPETRAPVLLVDDEDDGRSFLRETLERDGYPVVEAANGKEALDLLVSEGATEPCMILLDLAMPVMSGWEFLAVVKSYSRLARIPVVIVSCTPPQSEALVDGSIVHWVQKPHDAKQLVELVKAHALRRCG